MKFSVAATVAIAALAAAAPVVTQNQDNLNQLEVPKEIFDNFSNYLSDIVVVANTIAAKRGLDFTVPAQDQNDALNFMEKTLANSLAWVENYAEASHLKTWQNAISLDSPEAIEDIFSFVNERYYAFFDKKTSPAVNTVDEFVYTIDAVLGLFFAQEAAKAYETAHPDDAHKIIIDYSLPPGSLTVADVNDAIQEALEKYTAQVDAAYKAQQDAINKLNTQSTAGQADAEAAATLAKQAAAQAAQIEALQNQIEALQKDLKDTPVTPETPETPETPVTPASPVTPAEALTEIVEKAKEVSEQQQQIADQTAQAADETDSEVLKAIAEQLALQAEAIKKLSELENGVVDTDAGETGETETPETVEPVVSEPVVDVNEPVASVTESDSSVNITEPESPANITEPESSANITESTDTPAGSVELPTTAEAVANSNSESNSNSNSDSSSSSNSNANANVNIYLVNGNRINHPSNVNGTLSAANDENYITIYETDCPVTTTDASGATITTHTKSTVTSTVCPKCTKTAKPVESAPAAAKTTPAAAKSNSTEVYDDIVTVYVTDCPVTSVDSAGSTHIATTQSTVTSTVCTKCTKTVQTPKVNNGTVVIPTQQPKVVVPEQANGASKTVVGAAALALPMLMALL